LAVLFVIPELTNVFVAIGVSIAALAILFVIPPLPNVFIATGKSEGAKAVGPCT
jgi:hypothetical protein